MMFIFYKKVKTVISSIRTFWYKGLAKMKKIKFEKRSVPLNNSSHASKAEFLEKLNKHYPLGKYPIEFDQNRYEETVYKDTQKKTN